MSRMAGYSTYFKRSGNRRLAQYVYPLFFTPLGSVKLDRRYNTVTAISMLPHLSSSSGALNVVRLLSSVLLLLPTLHAYGVSPQLSMPSYGHQQQQNMLNQNVPQSLSYSVMPNNLMPQTIGGYSLATVPWQQQLHSSIPAATSCFVDLKCFSCSPGFSIAQGFPFERRTPVTCEECLELCLEKQSNPFPYCCRAAVYDFTYRSCDLFAVDGKTPPQVVTKYATRSYFVPTGQCRKGASHGKPGDAEDERHTEAEPLCPDGQSAKFVEAIGYTDSAFHGEHTLSGYNVKECQAACLENKDREGQPLPLEKACSAIASKDNDCQLSSTALGRISDLQSSPEVTYLTTICLPKKLVAQCPNNFVYAPGHVLVGFAKTVVTAATERECVEQCLMSSESLGFYCKSGMYYYEDSQENCILNTESRSTQPNVYTEDASQVVYFELGCGRTGRRLAEKFRKSFSQALYDIPALGVWTTWSTCQGPVGTSVRYRTCREKDIRNCPKEVQSCAHPSDSPSLPSKPSTAGRFPNDDLWKRKKDHTGVVKKQ